MSEPQGAIALDPHHSLLEKGSGGLATSLQNSQTNPTNFASPATDQAGMPNRQIRSNYIKEKPTTGMQRTLMDLNAPQKWSKFVNLDCESDSIPSHITTHIAMCNLLNTNEPHFSIDSNRIIVKSPSEKATDKLLSVNSIGKYKVKPTDKVHSNKKIGTIFLNDLYLDPNESNEYLEAMIKCILESQHNAVSEVSVYDRNSSKSNKKLKFARVTFSQQDLPHSVSIGNLKLYFRQVEQKPMQCRNCLLFNHTDKRCRDLIPRCFKCGSSDHPKDGCPSPQFICFNCKGNHHAFSRNCAHFIYHKEVLDRMSLLGISRREAKAFMKDEGKQLSNLSYAQAVSPTQQDSNLSRVQSQNSQLAHNQNLLQQNTRTTQKSTHQSLPSQPIHQTDHSSVHPRILPLETSNSFDILSDVTIQEEPLEADGRQNVKRKLKPDFNLLNSPLFEDISPVDSESSGNVSSPKHRRAKMRRTNNNSKEDLDSLPSSTPMVEVHREADSQQHDKVFGSKSCDDLDKGCDDVYSSASISTEDIDIPDSQDVFDEAIDRALDDMLGSPSPYIPSANQRMNDKELENALVSHVQEIAQQHLDQREEDSGDTIIFESDEHQNTRTKESRNRTDEVDDRAPRKDNAKTPEFERSSCDSFTSQDHQSVKVKSHDPCKSSEIADRNLKYTSLIKDYALPPNFTPENVANAKSIKNKNKKKKDKKSFSQELKDKSSNDKLPAPANSKTGKPIPTTEEIRNRRNRNKK